MSTIKTNTITDVAGSGGPTLTNGATFGTAAFAAPSGSAPIYACRAWVNFNGTGTVAIRASGNVSSITDNGTGLYTVNMTNAMPDSDYCVTLAKQNPAGTNINDIGIHNSVSGSVSTVAPTTSAFRIMLNNSLADSAYVMCAVLR